VHTRRWLSFFAARGHEVQLWTPFGRAVPPDLAALVEVRHFGRPNAPRIPGLASLASGWSLATHLKAARPDILHAHYLSSSGWLARLAGFHPWVVTAWGSDLLVDAPRTFRSRFRARQILAHADLVTVPAAHMELRAVEAGARPAHVRRVPFGVDTAAFSPAAAGDDEALAAVGLANQRFVFSPRTIRPVYRPDVVISALSILKPDVPVVMPRRGADGEYLRALRHRAEAAGVGHRLRVLDAITDDLMLTLYRAADVVLSVPESDGLPSSVLEAMSCGVPVVVSDLSGPREALGLDHPDLVVPVGDAEALAAVVNRLLALPDADRHALGALLRGRAIHRFDHATCMLEMERLYLSLVPAS
jgi:glycosyltransferase involved in cell wall biosynthesis